MTDTATQNGELAPQFGPVVMVRFGPGNDQEMPLSWAESMLSALADRQPKLFRDLAAEAMLAR
jgi:hypothetical protein